MGWENKLELNKLQELQSHLGFAHRLEITNATNGNLTKISYDL